MRNTCGFTIVEVLVALFVLSIGLLGTVSALGAVARSYTDGHDSVVASAAAAEILERERAEACGAATAGSWTEGAITYTWTIDRIGTDLRRVTVVVAAERMRSRVDTFTAFMPC